MVETERIDLLSSGSQTIIDLSSPGAQRLIVQHQARGARSLARRLGIR
jgi:hypothetical protein